jgi:hypothetical protein
MCLVQERRAFTFPPSIELVEELRSKLRTDLPKAADRSRRQLSPALALDGLAELAVVQEFGRGQGTRVARPEYASKRTEPELRVFSTQSGKPIEPKNVVQQWIAPACDKLGMKRVTWLTFRRTW